MSANATITTPYFDFVQFVKDSIDLMGLSQALVVFADDYLKARVLHLSDQCLLRLDLFLYFVDGYLRAKQLGYNPAIDNNGIWVNVACESGTKVLFIRLDVENNTLVFDLGESFGS